MSRHKTPKKSGSKKDGDKKDGGKTKVSSGKNKLAKKTTKSSDDLDGVVQPCVLVPLKDVLCHNNELHLFDDIVPMGKSQDDPPLIFCWKKVEAFVRAISDAYSQAVDDGAAVPPPPFAMPNPLTTESFKKALVAHVRERPLQPLGTSCLPGDIGETARAVSRLLWNWSPWVLHVVAVGGGPTNVLSIGDLYVFRLGTDKLVVPAPNGVRNRLM